MIIAYHFSEISHVPQKVDRNSSLSLFDLSLPLLILAMGPNIPEPIGNVRPYGMKCTKLKLPNLLPKYLIIAQCTYPDSGAGIVCISILT